MQAHMMQSRKAFSQQRTRVRARTAQMDRPAPVRSDAPVSLWGEAQKEAFNRDGFVHLTGVFSDEELSALEPAYTQFLEGQIPVPGKDLGDFRNSDRTHPEDFALLSVMLPRTYYPAWQGSLIEQRSLALAKQVLESDAELDFDQILAKRPRSRDSAMPFHQDAAYWPDDLADGTPCATGTANVWIALSDVPIEAGCMRYLPGSHLEVQLRPHEPAEDTSIALRAPVGGERVVLVPVKRGDVLVHHERVVHGSGPNLTDSWRRAYILNFKRAECVVQERAMGLTHSMNDVVTWTRAAVPPPTSTTAKP